MRINIKTKNMDLTDAISEYLYKRLEALEKFDAISEKDDDSVMAEVELGKTTNHHNKGDFFRAEINLRVDGNLLRAVSETGDLYASIDEMRDEIVREFRKSKNKKDNLLKKGHQKIKNIIKGLVE